MCFADFLLRFCALSQANSPRHHQLILQKEFLKSNQIPLLLWMCDLAYIGILNPIIPTSSQHQNRSGKLREGDLLNVPENLAECSSKFFRIKQSFIIIYSSEHAEIHVLSHRTSLWVASKYVVLNIGKSGLKNSDVISFSMRALEFALVFFVLPWSSESANRTARTD